MTKKTEATKQRPRPVPVPQNEWRGAAVDHSRKRSASGQTSIRVSKLTASLLKRVEDAAQKRAKAWRKIGLDELLYYDALERLGELPGDVEFGAD